jgi:hypothetical protein
MTANDDQLGLAPATLLAEVGALRQRARADRRGYWVPLLLFGLLTLGSLPLYVLAPLRCPPNVLCGGPLGPGFEIPALGGHYQTHRTALGWYWFAALLVGGLITVWWYRWHGRRRGVQGSAGVAVLVGLVGLAALLAGSSIWWWKVPYLMVTDRGTSAFLVIALGLLALAWLERSGGLAVIAVAYTGAALLATLYDLVNITSRLGWDLYATRYALWPNVLLPAAVLLVGAGSAALGNRWSRA